MRAYTHALGGLALTSLLFLYTNALGSDCTPAVIAAGVLGAVLPDIDHPKSKISNSFLVTKLASRVVSSVTVHRGMCHSLFFVILCVALAQLAIYLYLPHWNAAIPLWLGTGMVSHLLLDWLNPMGIQWFWPLGKHWNLLSIKTGGTGERIIATLLLVADIQLLYLCFSSQFM